MILTLAVITVIMLALALRLSVVSDRLAVREEASAARLFLERSYGYALASQQTIKVKINPSSMVTSLIDGKELETHRVRQGVSLSPNSAHRSELAMYPNLAVSPGSLNFAKGRAACSLIISLRGRFRVT
jgi:hypothetical protein